MNSLVAFYGNEISSSWQGIRKFENSDNFIICGNIGDDGFVYLGPIDCSANSTYDVMVPNSIFSSVYGSAILKDGKVRLVGSYRTDNSSIVYAFIFEGLLSKLSDPTLYRTFYIENAQFTYLHSTMGNLTVGNYDNLGEPGKAFIYNKGKIIRIEFPCSVSNTAYGIWYNGENHYTICGGFADFSVSTTDIRSPGSGSVKGYMVDYSNGKFSNWTSFVYPENNIVTHFQGISYSREKNLYSLVADVVLLPDLILQAVILTVSRDKREYFKVKEWFKINETSTTANSIADSFFVGIRNLKPFQAELLQ